MAAASHICTLTVCVGDQLPESRARGHLLNQKARWHNKQELRETRPLAGLGAQAKIADLSVNFR